MNSKSSNIDAATSYQKLVDELSEDLLKNQIDDSNGIDLNHLESRILKAAAVTPQIDSGQTNHKATWWSSLQARFSNKSFTPIYPLAAAMMLVAAVMIVGSPILPNDESVPSEALTLANSETHDTDPDIELTFQELWLAEDEILFAAGI